MQSLKRSLQEVPRSRGWIVLALVAIGIAFSGCADKSEAESTKAEPAKLVEVEGQDVDRVMLTGQAAKRLSIEMGVITQQGNTKVAPYASVVYDAKGKTWVYTSPKPLTFERTAITIARITGEKALLTAGPKTGTEVVTVGMAELFGIENEIGH